MGRGPRGCPAEAGLDGAGSRLLPLLGGGAGPAEGAECGGGGTAWSTRQLRAGDPGSPPHAEVKARAARRQLSQVGAEFARRLHGECCNAGRAGGISNPHSKGECPPPGARRAGEAGIRNSPRLGYSHPRPRAGKSRLRLREWHMRSGAL